MRLLHWLLGLFFWLAIRPFVPLVLLVKWLLLIPSKREQPDLTLVLPKSCWLVDGVRPTRVFAERLRVGTERYHRVLRAGLLVMGSIHKGRGGLADRIPLWQAAKEYLSEQGVPAEDIITETSSCYNGQTELVLAIKMCRELEQAGTRTELVVVSAHYVKLRSLLCCIWHGYLPEFIWVKEETTWKTWFEEFILTVYSLFDPDWQTPYSPMGWYTRKTREAR